MTRVTLALLIFICSASSAFAEARSPGDYVVTADSLNVRLGADTSAKIVDKLYQQQKIGVLEIRDGWARISQYYDGVTEGVPGKVARWVFATHLSALRVTTAKVDPASPVYQAISGSDDLEKHQHIFVAVSKKLVEAGECKLSDFKDIGGWWRSPAHKARPIYYTYCGGAGNNHRVYVDIETGHTFH